MFDVPVHARERALPAPRHRKAARDLEGAGIHLDDLVVHHARRIEERPGRVEAGAVRHRARLDLLDLDHVGGVHHRDRRGDHLAVQVEVGHEGVEPVGRKVERGREVSEQDRIADQCVGAGVKLPQLSIGDPVAGGHEEELAVARDVEPVGPLRLGGHLADHDGPVQGSPFRAEADTVEQIGGLRTHVYVIVGLRRCLGVTGTWSPQTEQDRPTACSARHQAHKPSSVSENGSIRLPFTNGRDTASTEARAA